uniref:Uncharacterized protein n=1 Tax=Oryza sativa subsp. japonica TaxID=39947 RepID=Q2R3P3_ORYSJ|nr:hypothetical protein LOC_Os11g31250 [Oryza sativa Japonica Group]
MGKSTAIGPLTGRSRLLPPSGYGGAVEKVVEAQGEVKAASVMAAATTTTSCGDSATATATTSYNDNVTGGPYKVRLRKGAHSQAHLIWSARRRFTPIYIFIGGHLAPKVISACENKTPTLGKMLFLVVFIDLRDKIFYICA